MLNFIWACAHTDFVATTSPHGSVGVLLELGFWSQYLYHTMAHEKLEREILVKNLHL